MRLSERGISNEQPAIPPGDAGDSTFLVAPIEGQAQRFYISRQQAYRRWLREFRGQQQEISFGES
jgi:hypothetical protein